MKNKFLLIILSVFLLQTGLKAADNVVKLNAGFPRPMSLEYERKLGKVFPGLRAFATIGSGSFDIEDSSTELSGFSLGARYKIPFIGYVSAGYGTLNVDYSYVATVQSGQIQANDTVYVDGKLAGLFFEIGKEFGVGPVVVGGKFSYLMAKPDVSAKVREQEITNDEDVQKGVATVDGIPEASLYVGFAF